MDNDSGNADELLRRTLAGFQMKEAVRDAVESQVGKEITRLEGTRSKIYRAYAVVGAIILGVIGITSWQQIPQVVASLIREPASGQLAQVFREGQDSAKKLQQQTVEAQQKIDDLSRKIQALDEQIRQVRALEVKAEGDVNRTSSFVTKSAALTSQASTNIEEVKRLQGEVNTQVKNSKESVAQLQRDFAEVEKSVVEIEYLQYVGRNVFPNPYHDRIMWPR
jgi:methyl-accepting chemotaxis protein